jgi:hypothetical protein
MSYQTNSYLVYGFSLTPEEWDAIGGEEAVDDGTLKKDGLGYVSAGDARCGDDQYFIGYFYGQIDGHSSSFATVENPTNIHTDIWDNVLEKTKKRLNLSDRKNGLYLVQNTF